MFGQLCACLRVLLDFRFVFDERSAPRARIKTSSMWIDGMRLQRHRWFECCDAKWTLKFVPTARISRGSRFRLCHFCHFQFFEQNEKCCFSRRLPANCARVHTVMLTAVCDDSTLIDWAQIQQRKNYSLSLVRLLSVVLFHSAGTCKLCLHKQLLLCFRSN